MVQTSLRFITGEEWVVTGENLLSGSHLTCDSAGCPAMGDRAVHSLWDQLLTQAFWAVSSAAHYFRGLWTAWPMGARFARFEQGGGHHVDLSIRISTLIWISRGIHTALYVGEQWAYSCISFTSSLISFTDRADGPSFYSLYQPAKRL